METLLLLVGLFALNVLYGYLKNMFDEKQFSKSKNKPSSYLKKQDSYFEYDLETPPKKEQSTVNNYYLQQNIYVQKNSYHQKSKDKHKDHSKRVWERMGYRVRRGETYAYKFYGNEIFRPDQVERAGVYQVNYSEAGLAKKLLNDTGSIAHAKDILVDDYGLSESKATRLLKNGL